MKGNIIRKTFANVPWTTPAPIGAALATMDFKAFFLVLILLGIDVLIWYPFFKAYERQLLKAENE